MGKPGWSNVQSSSTEYIGCRSETRGSETSQYPKEKKSTEMPQVVASERGNSPNRGVYSAGLRDFKIEHDAYSNGMGRPAVEGESPVREMSRGIWKYPK